jgi:long-subunit fatty acid transport protein
VRFRETGNYNENVVSTDEDLRNWRYVDELNTRGTGLNIKFGVIARVQEWLRVGAAVHSPTYLTLSDQYTTSMYSDFRDGSHYEWDSPYGSFTYSLRTPARYMANMAFVLGKSGLVSADYEYTDYSRAELSDTGIGEGYSFDAENEAVKTIYRGTHSVKAGMEWRLTEAFRLRAGAAYRQSPFESGVAVNTPELIYSGGFGWRKDAFSAEFVLMHRQRDESYFLYDPSAVSETSMQQQRWAGLISLGFRY